MKKKVQTVPEVFNYRGELISYKPDSWREDMHHNWSLYLLFIPVAAFFILFHYIPMAGIAMAFEKYDLFKGVFGSEWIGFDNFVTLFSGDDMFLTAIRNTIAMALMNLTLGFFAPVLLALLISQVRYKKFTRVVQTVSYMPYFVSTVVITTLATNFLSSTGAITLFLSWFGFEKQNWLANPNVPVFWVINTALEIWQGAGWGSIVYIAAIANVNGDLHEAAAIDGANRWQRLWKITMPSVLPLIIMMFSLRVGMVFRTGFDKVLLLYMPKTFGTADCLATYTHRLAFVSNNYGVSTASGLFQSLVGTILLVFSNWLSGKVAKTKLF